jgi:hypothetical protein
MTNKKLTRLIVSVATFGALILAAPERAHTQAQDVIPPTVLELNFAPDSIDVSAGHQAVTVNARITDALAGYQSGSLHFRSPSGQQLRFGDLGFSQRVSGDALDGSYQTTVTFQQFSEAGTWKLNAFVIDVVGNGKFFTDTDLAGFGFPTELQVTGGPDLAPPMLLEIGFSPQSIDISNSSQVVTLNARITDSLSGYQSGSLHFRSPSGQQLRFGDLGASQRVSGDSFDASYQTTVTFQQFSEAGTWKLNVFLIDAVGNGRFLSDTDLAGFGFATDLHIISIPDDTSAPQLVELSFGPASIDTSAGSQVVTVNARSTDGPAGYQSGSLHFRSPSGQQVRFGDLGATQRVSGDAFDGTLQTAVQFPQFSEAGTWKLNVFLIDAVGNSRFFTDTDLANAGFPTQLEVTQAPQLTALGPANVWIGLKNSDDVGTKFDLLAEVFKNGSPVGSGQVNAIAGGSSGFNNAVSRTIGLALASPVSIGAGDTLSFKLSVRIAAGVPGHRSGTARLWFNDSEADSRLGTTIGGVASEYFLLNNLILGPTSGSGPRKTIDVFVDRGAGGNPFKPFATWSKTF